MNDLLHIKTDRLQEENFNINSINFHPVLKDIENIFWLFLLSNKALSLPETQQNLSLDLQFQPILKKYNKWSNLEIERDKHSNVYTTKLNVRTQMNLIGKTMTILTYDYLLASKYNSSIQKNSNIQFLRYIRNGAAHNNKFNLKDEEGKWKIGKNETIQWRDKKINRSLHGKTVFPDFFSIFGMFLLAKEFSEILIELDNKHNLYK